jgi:hypothetical protein
VSVPVYSERFLRLGAAGGQSFVVPVGQRAIINCITLVNWSGAPRQGQLLLAGTPIWRASVPGNLLSTVEELRAVAYGGEELYLGLDGADLYVTVSGYLFADSTSATGPPAFAATLPAPETDPWPATA